MCAGNFLVFGKGPRADSFCDQFLLSSSARDAVYRYASLMRTPPSVGPYSGSLPREPR